MGKSFELLGLAAFNVFLALILAVTFLGGDKERVPERLTEAHVAKFINEVNDISRGNRRDMDNFSITSYFMQHIADNGKFVNIVQYNLPRIETQEQVLEMGKLDFISHILKGMNAEREETIVNIEHIEIIDNGRSAHIITTNFEKGVLPFDDGSGRPHMMPVSGQSFCEQKIAINGRRIQITGANCTTAVQLAEY